jgi:LPS-assembly protein
MSRRLSFTYNTRRAFKASTAVAAFAMGLYGGFAHPAVAAEPVPAATAPEDPNKQTLMEADLVTYDKDRDVVTATGRVEIQQGGQVLLADKVEYDRKTDTGMATGHVALLEPGGTTVYVESVEVSGDLKEALAGEVRTMMADKSRMTGRAFRRSNRIDELYEGAYTACDVCKGEAPVWRIQASEVRRDIDAQMIYYHDVWLDLLGVPVFYTPYLASPDPSAGRKSGFLMPAIGGGSNLGGSYAQPYYWNIAPDRDATITPVFTSAAGNGGTLEYRQAFQHGRFTFFGSAVGGDSATTNEIRGNIHSVARWDIDDNWRSGADVNLASDQTYIRRYSAVLPGPRNTSQPWLTTNAFIERFGTNTYFSANAYYFQRQLEIIAQKAPVVSPLLYFNYTSDPMSWGGFLKADVSSVVLTRDDGADSQRLSTNVGYDLPFTTPQGFVMTAHTGVRADGYYVQDLIRPSNGQKFNGTVGRVAPEASVEWRWPLERMGTDITQIIEPIAKIIVSPKPRNPETIPNEDSSDFEFDDTNLFEEQRFPGYDRIEGGARVAYGVKWSAYNHKGGTVSAMIGQSYAFRRNTQFGPLSGLYYRQSDYVGHVDFSPNQYVSLQYRFRFDKDSFANRRTEITGIFGPELFRTIISYIDIPQTNPASPRGLLQQRELYTAVSAKISRYWSVTADHRLNLGTGGGAIRTSAGVNYEDECFIFNLNFVRDNTSDRDFKSGIGILLRLGFKTVGDLKLNTDVGAR